MSEPEAELLEAIVNNGGAIYAREVTSEIREPLRLLLDRDYIRRTGALDHARYEVTEAGRVALSEFAEERRRRADQQAREDRQRHEAKIEAARNRRNVLVSGIVSALVSAVVTLLMRHFLG